MKYRSTSYTIFTVFNSIFMIFVILACFLPYLNVLAISLNEGLDTMTGGVTFLPRRPTLENFRLVLSQPIITNSAIISVLRVILGTVLTVSVTFSAAYSLRKKDLAGRKTIMFFLMIPAYFTAGIIPIYILYSRIDMLNNFLVYILPAAYNFFYMVLIRTYLMTAIPDSLEESAKIDGAGELTIMLKIYIPLAKPVLATIALYTAVGHWNDWTTTLYYAAQDERVFTLQYVLMQTLRESERMSRLLMESARAGVLISKVPQTTPESIRCAQIVVTTLPIILMYPFLQKYFIKGLTLGSVKE